MKSAMLTRISMLTLLFGFISFFQTFVGAGTDGMFALPEPSTRDMKILMAHLKSLDYAQRLNAARDCIIIGEDAREAVPLLTQYLTQDKETTALCATAAIALGRMGPAARSAIPALIEASQNRDLVDLRLGATSALGSLFIPIICYFPSYPSCLMIAEPGATRLHTLNEYGVEGSKIVPALIRVLQNEPDARVRQAADESIAMVRPQATEAIPALLAQLRRERSRSSIISPENFATPYSLDTPAVTALKQVCGFTDEANRNMIRVMIKGHKVIRRKPIIEEGTKPCWDTGEPTIRVTLPTPPEGFRVAEYLLDMIQKDEAGPADILLLSVTGPQMIDVTPYDHLDEPVDAMPRSAWFNDVTYKPVSEKVVPSLRGLLHNWKSIQHLEATVLALKNLGSDAGPAVPDLIKLLDEPEVRKSTGFCLIA